MAKLTLADIAAGFGLITTYNANNALLEAALENTLSRDGTAPNTMSANLDMNSQRIVNLAQGVIGSDAVTLQQVTDTITAAADPLTSATAALVSLLDIGGNYTATDVEAAFTELASVLTGEGASILGLEDSGGFYTATEVEAALAEIFATPSATTRRLLELATQAEVDAGIDTTRAITSATLAGAALSPQIGSFTATLTGYAANPTGTVNFITEKLDATRTRVTLWTETSIFGTSNSTAMTMTGLPTALNPTTSGIGSTITPVINNGKTQVTHVVPSNTQTLTFEVPDNDWQAGLGDFSNVGFVASSTKGLPLGWTTTYIID